jgi:hypothetical protein
MKVCATLKPVVKRRKPATREGRQRSPWLIALAMGPDQIFARFGDRPWGQRLSPHQRPKELTLDLSGAATREDAGRFAPEFFHLHHERIVASGFNAKERAPEAAEAERNSGVSKAIERLSGEGG